ncbi:MAG: hypothetical protein RLP44_03750 [Aggregatilineales bacterium]
MAATEERQTNDEQLLQMAIDTAKRGNGEAARNMFREVWNRNKRNERALMWLARLAKTPKEQKQWLDRILRLNPNNETAKTALSQMKNKSAAVENRLLIIFGAVAVIMLVLFVVILVIALT